MINKPHSIGEVINSFAMHHPELIETAGIVATVAGIVWVGRKALEGIGVLKKN